MQAATWSRQAGSATHESLMPKEENKMRKKEPKLQTFHPSYFLLCSGVDIQLKTRQDKGGMIKYNEVHKTIFFFFCVLRKDTVYLYFIILIFIKCAI